MKKNGFKKLKRSIRNLKFRANDLFLFSNKEKLPLLSLPSQYSLKVIDSNEKSGIKQIDRRKKNNNLCYAVFDSEKLVHTSWLFKKHSISTQLGYKDALTIGPCETIKSHRGKGIYPAVLSTIQKDNPDAELVIFVKMSNAPSIQGIMKAGFQKILRFKMLKIFGFKFAFRHKHL
ncbi:MAG TPA: hypothetical protein VH396_18005 [Chitinophagaceae bacterium]|jgi:hypothetical protein